MIRSKKTCTEKGCTYPAWSKNKCKMHHPNKNKNTNRYEGMLDMFMEVWNERNHTCWNCNCYLGKEPKTYHFHHILPKSKYPQFYNDKDNIVLLCLDCHSNVDNIERLKNLTNAKKERANI